MIDSIAQSPPRETFFSGEAEEELPLALVAVVRDPETEKGERELVIPFSLLMKLWPELTPTMERLEEILKKKRGLR
jgi:hypothetical protein